MPAIARAGIRRSPRSPLVLRLNEVLSRRRVRSLSIDLDPVTDERLIICRLDGPIVDRSGSERDDEPRTRTVDSLVIFAAVVGVATAALATVLSTWAGVLVGAAGFVSAYGGGLWLLQPMARRCLLHTTSGGGGLRRRSPGDEGAGALPRSPRRWRPCVCTCARGWAKSPAAPSNSKAVCKYWT